MLKKLKKKTKNQNISKILNKNKFQLTLKCR